MEPLSIEPPQVGMLMVLAFFSSILGASSGFGGALLLTPFLIPFVGVKGVVPVMTIAMTLGNFSRVWVYRKDVKLRYAVRFMLPIVLGVVIGTMIFQGMPERLAAVVIGTFLICSVPLRRHFKRRAIQPNAVGINTFGFGFGILTGSTPGAGVLLLSLLLGAGLTGPTLIGTDAAIGVVVNIAKASMFSSLDLLDKQRGLLGLMIGCAMLPGAYIARMVLERLSVHVHTAMMEVLVVFAGLSFFWRAMFP